MIATEDIEEIILKLADIIVENRLLKLELKEMKHKVEYYRQRENERQEQLNKGMETLFEAGMAGVFTNPSKKDV